MKHKTNYWYAAAAFFCTVTVLLSLLPSAVFADYPSQEEGEEIVEEVPSNEGKLIIGNADGSAGENEGKRIVLSTAEDFQAFSLNCRNNVWSIGLTVYLDADIDFEGRSIMPVPSFSGTFLGNGHTIKNFYCGSNGSHQGLFRYLQRAGEYNWKAYHRHHGLRPFCWLYQIFRYIRQGMGRIRYVRADLARGNDRYELLKKLGI